MVQNSIFKAKCIHWDGLWKHLRSFVLQIIQAYVLQTADSTPQSSIRDYYGLPSNTFEVEPG